MRHTLYTLSIYASSDIKAYNVVLAFKAYLTCKVYIQEVIQPSNLFFIAVNILDFSFN
jgi:hypothetical protein